MNTNEKIFNELINTRKKLALIDKERRAFDEGDKDSKYIFSYVFSVMASAYSAYSIKNNKIKDIDFSLTELLLSNVNDEDNYAVNFKEDVILYETNKITIRSPHGNCIFTYKKTPEDGVMYLKGSSGGLGFDDLKTLEKAKQIGLSLTRAKKFQNELIAVLDGDSFESFVKRYKENRELLTIVFIYIENEKKEALFKEIKKQDKALSMADIEQLIKVLKNASNSDKEYKHKERNKALPRGWYHALTIEDIIENKNRSVNFNLIKSLFAYDSLDEKLSNKDAIKVSASKIKI